MKSQSTPPEGENKAETLLQEVINQQEMLKAPIVKEIEERTNRIKTYQASGRAL